MCLALSKADAAREVTASGSFSTDMTAQTFPAASSGIPCIYESDVMHHPVTGEEHAYIMQQLLGPSLHELVDEGYVTRETFLPVSFPVLLSPHEASTHSLPDKRICKVNLTPVCVAQYAAGMLSALEQLHKRGWVCLPYVQDVLLAACGVP